MKSKLTQVIAFIFLFSLSTVSILNIYQWFSDGTIRTRGSDHTALSDSPLAFIMVLFMSFLIPIISPLAIRSYFRSKKAQKDDINSLARRSINPEFDKDV